MSTENTLETIAETTVNRLEFSTPNGGTVALDLQHPLTLPVGRYSPYAVCRMCVARLSLKTLERLLLSMLLDEMECGVARPHSYQELGRSLCKCAHSIKAAMAALRASGLVVTTRVGFGDAAVSVSCESLVRWAERVLSPRLVVPESEESVHDPAFRVSILPELVSKNEESVTKRVSGRTHPRRVRKPAPSAAKKEDTPVQAVKPDVPPPASAAAMQDDVMAQVEDLSVSELVEDFDTPVDGSEELAGTLKAAGRAQGVRPSDDEDDFSFGSETAETDIGHGVKINPDL